MPLLINAGISGIVYEPLLCSKLPRYDFQQLKAAFDSSAFLLKKDEDYQAVSWWVSPKRTRSYPFERVYNTLSYNGKRVTIIPFVKDEGKDGDRDFIQWDTISLMSLLHVYMIISYYESAEKNNSYKNKITKQSFHISHIETELKNLISYQSSPLHWNIDQIDKLRLVADKAMLSYETISRETGVALHSFKGLEQKISQITKGKDYFMNCSRNSAKLAQNRESLTVQPKELIAENKKAKIVIKNYLGGEYYLTCDEATITGDTVFLAEAKHTKNAALPSLSDIKDGLIKMILYTNLKDVTVGNSTYKPSPILKLTSEKNQENLNDNHIKILNLLKDEANKNGFCITLNEERL
jgi:hypothetical protein